MLVGRKLRVKPHDSVGLDTNTRGRQTLLDAAEPSAKQSPRDGTSLVLTNDSSHIEALHGPTYQFEVTDPSKPMQWAQFRRIDRIQTCCSPRRTPFDHGESWHSNLFVCSPKLSQYEPHADDTTNLQFLDVLQPF